MEPNEMIVVINWLH